MTLSSHQIRSHFKCQADIADKDFFVPSRTWLVETFGQWYQEVLKAFGETKWKEHFDCDNFSDLYHALAQVCNAKRKPPTPQAVAVGKIWYVTRDEYAHAINCAFIRKDRKPKLVFVEPQGPDIVPLTKKEIESIYWVRF